MSRRSAEIDDALLLGYADGKLDAEDRAAVEAFLARNPDRAALVAGWQRQNDALSALFQPAALESMPRRLDPHVLAARPGFAPPLLRMAAAAVVLVAIGAGAGWFARGLAAGGNAAETLIETAITAHALYVKEKRHAVEVPAEDEKHLVTWLSNRLDRTIAAPDLGEEGFALVGGRLLPTEAAMRAGPAAQLMYEKSDAQRLTIFITAGLPQAGTRSAYVERDGQDAYYWADDRVTCTVVGNLPREDLQTIARNVHRQLSALAAPPL